MDPTSEDDDVTVSRGAGTPASTSRAAASHSLAIGTRLHEFELTDRLGEGGFSIVYTAWDHSLERRVAVKEYMPGSIATRDGETHVDARSEDHRETFEAGLRSFVNESKLLAMFDHRSLVKVYRFWEANGTAYMVMPFYDGVTLKKSIEGMAAPPDEAWLRALLEPLTEALQVIHAASCYHRDIAPDNILLLGAVDRPLLLDFGAARRVIGDMSQALTVILKPGYAPIEQYADVPDMTQGPWTDVYALSAVVYWAVTGQKPAAAIARMLRDKHVPLATLAGDRYSPEFVAAIDRGLALLPKDRTQTIAAFRHDLGLGRPAARTADRTSAPAPPVDDDVTVMRPPAVERKATTEAADTTTPAATPPTGPTAAPSSPREPAPRPAPAPPSRLPLIAGTGVGVVAIAALAAWFWPHAPAPAPPPAAAAPLVQSAPAPAPVSVNMPAPRPASEPMAVPTVDPAAARLPRTVPAPPPPQAIAAPAPTAHDETAAVAAPVRKTSSPRADKPKPAAVADKAADNSAECARLLQRMSLGDTSADLMNRAGALKCR